MGVSKLASSEIVAPPRGARERTRRLMLETATRMMQAGQTPSVTEVAETAGISRATAYRCFASQAALVKAVVDQALGPILSWSSDSADAEARVVDLLESSLPRIVEFESTFKAALKLTLEQWASRQSGKEPEEPQFRRGHRIDLLQQAISPLKGELTRTQFTRLAKSLSLVYGLEVLIVLKDLWGLKPTEIRSVTTWAGRALVRAAIAEGQRSSRPLQQRGAGDNLD